MVAEKFIMSIEQYHAVDRFLTESHIGDWCQIIQIDKEDFVYDLETENTITLADGLKEAFAGFENNDNVYELTEADAKALISLTQKLKIPFFDTAEEVLGIQ